MSANEWIGNHADHDLLGVSERYLFSKNSAAAQADPPKASLKALEQTSFQGTALRGLLLEAYAFGTFGAIAL